MSSLEPKIHQSWLEVLLSEFSQPYFKGLRDYLMEEKRQNTVYPPGGKIFAAFNHTPFDLVKAIIIGQDPYHGPGQANGLSFSVSPEVNPPPSLKNIFKELQADLGHNIPTNGDLTHWANEGVLMLNTVLTVRHKEPASHRNKGWENFTDAVIHKISEQKTGLVFILWGKFAQSKKELIDGNKHHIIESAHPSPYSANNGFFGSKPFSRCNDYLKKINQEPIDWKL